MKKTHFHNPPTICPKSGDIEALKIALCHSVFYQKQISFTVAPDDLPLAMNIIRDTGCTVTGTSKWIITPPAVEPDGAPDAFFGDLPDEIEGPEIEIPSPSRVYYLKNRKQQIANAIKYYAQNRDKINAQRRKRSNKRKDDVSSGRGNIGRTDDP